MEALHSERRANSNRQSQRSGGCTCCRGHEQRRVMHEREKGGYLWSSALDMVVVVVEEVVVAEDEEEEIAAGIGGRGNSKKRSRTAQPASIPPSLDCHSFHGRSQGRTRPQAKGVRHSENRGCTSDKVHSSWGFGTTQGGAGAQVKERGGYANTGGGTCNRRRRSRKPLGRKSMPCSICCDKRRPSSLDMENRLHPVPPAEHLVPIVPETLRLQSRPRLQPSISPTMRPSVVCV
jgi:hypothetical protein